MLPLLDCDNALQVLDEINPTLWSWNSESVKQFRANPFKKINSILVHHDAMLWHDFHNDETWDCEHEVDDNGFLVTQFTCRLDFNEQISDVVLSYYGAQLGYEHYDY